MEQTKNKLEEVAKYAIRYIKSGIGYPWMRDSFNEYCDMTHADDREKRHINAQRVAIECIYALDRKQLRRLDKKLEAVVKNPKIGAGIKQS